MPQDVLHDIKLVANIILFKTCDSIYKLQWLNQAQDNRSHLKKREEQYLLPLLCCVDTSSLLSLRFEFPSALLHKVNVDVQMALEASIHISQSKVNTSPPAIQGCTMLLVYYKHSIDLDLKSSVFNINVYCAVN